MITMQSLVERLSPVFAKRARYWCKYDKDHYDDLIQDAWVDVLKGATQIKDDDKLESWGQRIMDNAYLKYIRRHRTKTDAYQIPLMEHDIETASNQDDVISCGDILKMSENLCRNRINMLILRLSLVGYTQRDIADMLGMSSQQCKCRKHYIIRRMRAKMKARQIREKKIQMG